MWLLMLLYIYFPAVSGDLVGPRGRPSDVIWRYEPVHVSSGCVTVEC